jgi:EmrB/QacA subfamily drug resistance transporter
MRSSWRPRATFPDPRNHPEPDEPADATSRSWVALAGLTLVTFLLLLDDTAVAVAGPAIQRRFDLDLQGMQWVVNSYTLTIAALILLAGQLADRLGRKRMYLAGLAIFTLASLGAGLVPSGPLLIAMRAVQGLGAALVTPTALAIIADSFPRRRRGLAIGIWSGVSASALGLGPLFGALILDGLGWRWIFLVNVPFGVGVWLLARTILRDAYAPRPTLQLDLAGAALSGGGLLALLIALTQTNDAGWLSSRVIALFVTAAVCVVLFVRHERRTAEPLVPVALFKDRVFAGANAQILLATSVMCSLFFFLALYIQVVLDYTALVAGIALLPLTVTIVMVGPLAGWLAGRIGPAVPVTLGMLFLAAALLGLSGLDADSTISGLMPWLMLAGVAIGLVTAPTTATAMASTDADGHGSAAAVFSTFQTTGLTLGIAIMGAILTSFGGGGAFARTLTAEHHEAFVQGFSTAVTVNAVIALLAAALAAVLLRPRTSTHAGPATMPAGDRTRP